MTQPQQGCACPAPWGSPLGNSLVYKKHAAALGHLHVALLPLVLTATATPTADGKGGSDPRPTAAGCPRTRRRSPQQQDLSRPFDP